MSLQSHFELLARYNKRMNQSIYEASSKLSTSELAENRGAFFHSILGTLNHVLVGDTIWLQRFALHSSKLKSLDYARGLSPPDTLDSILYTDYEDLLHSRTKMDDVIYAFTQELSDSVLSSSLSYFNTKGEPFNKNFGFLIQHFFNHQTHHRGQITTLLSQVKIDTGVTDLLAIIPDNQ